MIRIDAMWLAADPIDMRAGADRLLARVAELGAGNHLEGEAVEGVLHHLETAEEPNLPWLVARCCRYKAAVVSRDERDGGGRRVLNFGHTFGHAYEAAGGYDTRTHGEAVAAGMMQMLRWQVYTAAFGGVVLLLTVLFQATGKIIPSFLLSISRQGVVFLLALVVCVHLFQYQGVLMAQAVADILSAALALGLLAASRDIIAKQ